MTTDEHHCHVPGCDVPVPPKRLMCPSHWYMVPAALRRRVWATYRAGQEADKLPSRDWVTAAKDAIDSVLKAYRAA